MKTKFERDILALDELFNFLDVFIEKHQLDASFAFAIKLVVEELFINMVKYNSNNTNPLSVSLSKEEGKVVIELVDYNVDPFDITQFEEFDRTQSLEKREPGGMGIHLVKKMMDDIHYNYNAEKRTSKIRLIKYLRK
jgi:anti-sigma regulatory factor (Ser/Thr protein kinase)